MKTSRIARSRELLAPESSAGAFDGDDVDWPTSPEGGTAPSDNDQWKAPVRVATTAAITIATGLNAGDTIDDVTLAAGDRVLVKDQAAPAENGIYEAGTAPERTSDMDDDDEVVGALVYVVAGTTNAGTTWRATNATPPVIDTDAITFAKLGEPTADAHVADTTDAHDASAVSYDNATSGLTATDVQAAIDELEASGGGGVSLSDATPVQDGGAGDAGVGTDASRDDHHHPGDAVGIVAVIDGGGSAITTGVKLYLSVPFACTITANRALADQSGDIVVDVWKDTYANYPPTDADSITAAAPITISSGTKSEDATLTGWTTSVAAGDVLAFNVDSATTVELVTITLTATRT